jgi:predicted alpha/beta-fold hydrolase
MILYELKEHFIKKGHYQYDRSEILKLSDGGQIILEYKFKEKSSERPILIIIPGITGDS